MCLLIDLANRGITGHSAGRARDASLVLGAFATLDFPLTEVEVFHTDRGGGFDNARIDGVCVQLVVAGWGWCRFLGL